MTLLLLFGASPVLAQTGLNLSWDDCGAFGAASKSFGCDTNVGSSTLVSSFIAPPNTCVIGLSAVIDLQTSGASLPDWWRFKNSGSCRPSAIVSSFDFTDGPPNCSDFWQGAASGGFSYAAEYGGPNRGRLVVSAAEPFECIPIPEGLEAYAFKLIVSNTNTVGSGSCSGCLEGACIVLNSIELVQYQPAGNRILTAPLVRNHVVWQGGIPNCPGATAARSGTWGSVKSLYR